MEYEPARGDHIVHTWPRGRDREVSRASIEIPYFASEPQPSDPTHVDAAAKLNRVGVGVLLRGIRAAVRLELRLRIARIPCADGPKNGHRALTTNGDANARCEIERGVLLRQRSSGGDDLELRRGDERNLDANGHDTAFPHSPAEGRLIRRRTIELERRSLVAGLRGSQQQ